MRGREHDWGATQPVKKHAGPPNEAKGYSLTKGSAEAESNVSLS